MIKQSSYNRADLIRCGEGKLFGEGNARLPLPPMLMFDQIISISENNGKYNHGQVIAELKVDPGLWFFKCHFENDPVMPGCLGVDAMWQLIGFFLAWRGGKGVGRALGAGEIKFSGQVLPETKKITYIVDIKKLVQRRLCIGLADAKMESDQKQIYVAQDLKVGLFQSANNF